MKVYKEAERSTAGEKASVGHVVREIIDNVTTGGDETLLELGERFDGLRLDALRVGPETVKAAYNRVSAELVADLRFAADRIGDFARHQRSCLQELRYEISPGVTLGHRLVPIASCGCYV